MPELLEAGVHFGHQVRRGNPKMGSFIYGARDGVHIIDLAQSEKKLQAAAEAAFKLGQENKVLLVVGTKKQAKEVVNSLAQEADTPYLTERWIGGLLTNFDEVKKNLKKLTTLKEEQDKGLLSHYTKKERLLISRKLAKFDKELGGIAKLDKIPDAIFIVDAMSDYTAVKEANKVGILLFGIADSNANPNWFDYPVPGNDDGIKSIKLLCQTIIGAYSKGKADHKITKEAADKKAAESVEEVQLTEEVKQETAAIEEEIEKKIVAESDRKTE